MKASEATQGDKGEKEDKANKANKEKNGGKEKWLEREEKNEALKTHKTNDKKRKNKIFTKNQRKTRNINIETCETSIIYKTCKKE
jgi:hypothetical protein